MIKVGDWVLVDMPEFWGSYKNKKLTPLKLYQVQKVQTETYENAWGSHDIDQLFLFNDEGVIIKEEVRFFDTEEEFIKQTLKDIEIAEIDLSKIQNEISSKKQKLMKVVWNGDADKSR
jgi:hypothetical protein